MESEIDHILHPKVLHSLHQRIPPVHCIIWKGGNRYDTVVLDRRTDTQIYPFDTIDTIKRMLCYHFRQDSAFIPRFLFVGVSQENPESKENPTEDTTYLPIDYLWYPPGSNDPTQPYYLKHPLKALREGDDRFVTRQGSFTSPNYDNRGRTMIEDVFLKPSGGKLPVFHVFPLSTLLQTYQESQEIAEENWNRRFAAYYPDISRSGPYQATDADRTFAEKVHYFISHRETSVNRINEYLEEEIQLPEMTLTGVRQLLLSWPKPVEGFEGCASLFYQLPVTKERPYLRLFPADGTAITKLHVEGVLPIPSLDDPQLLEVWSKEVNPTNSDYCSIKYVNRPSMGDTQSIYGTIRVLNDGTINLLLQPPINVRYLHPSYDFRNFTTIMENVFRGLPQSFNDCKLQEIAAIFALTTELTAKKFTTERLQQRLPFFKRFFTEITPLPDENPILSIRYKAVSQYATEDKILSFITQLATKKRLLRGVPLDASDLELIQEEFEISYEEARHTLEEWFKKESAFTLALPEEGEFMQNYNPGIDIHIYAQQSSYHFHVHRIDSYQNYQRVYSLLSLLFYSDDDYFAGQENDPVEDEVEQEMEENSLSMEREEAPSAAVSASSAPVNSAVSMSMPIEMGQKKATVSALPSWLAQSLMADEEDEDIEEEPVAAQPAVSAPVSAPKLKRPGVAPKVEEVAEEAPKLKRPGVAQVQAQAQAASSRVVRIDPKGWLIKKLQQIDPTLFDYKTVDKKSQYSRLCQEERQPAGLTKAQYDAMKEIYAEDNVFWIEYPLEGKEDPRPPANTEVITVMRYGSTVNNIRYYFCPKYFCIYDEIMVLEKDFEGTMGRDGKSKPPETCPFCRGTLITGKTMVPGQTVLRSKNKTGSRPPRHQSNPDFLSTTTHPNKWELPCCFLKMRYIPLKDPAYERLKLAFQEEQYNHQPVMEEEEGDQRDILYQGEETVEYGYLFQVLHDSYILESNKKDLSPGTFAMASPTFDRYFVQNSSESIAIRPSVKFELRSNAVGFLRIGVENPIYESLLGAIAPVLYQTTIKGVKELIESKIVPKMFLNANFGNLVLEFFDPTDASAMPSTSQQLMDWAQDKLKIPISSNNLYQMMRVYNSHTRFIRFIKNPRYFKDFPQPIELRHIQPLLAEPGLFTIRGIQLIILENNDPVTVKCPPFGISMDRHLKNDFVFLSRTMLTIGTTKNKYSYYELYLYTSNRPARGADAAVHETIVRWPYHTRGIWPEIVKQRIEEYTTQCQARHRSIDTSQQGIQPMAMVPLSMTLRQTPRPTGVIKDSYNHVVAVTYPIEEDSPYMVILPIVDDGIFTISALMDHTYLDWEDVKKAPLDQVVEFYQTQLLPFTSLYPGYDIEHMVRNAEDQQVVALQLRNGLYVPTAPPKSAINLPTTSITMFEWDINKDIAGIPSTLDMDDWEGVKEEMETEKGCGVDSELMRKSDYIEFEESYQQFRLMVSNWITGERGGAELRAKMEEIMFNRTLPEYEKRKRMFLLIGSILLKWFYADEEMWDKGPANFLRKDCNLITQERSCTGTCVWREEENKCLLHVHATTNLGSQEEDKNESREVNTPMLFTKRVIDELIRFPARRKQIMSQGKISKLSTILQPIRQGDQYIIPESSPTWTNLLQLEWLQQASEKPRYYEEMSREDEDDQKYEDPMPDELKQMLGDHTPFHIMDLPVNPEQPLLTLLGILGMTAEELGVEEGDTILSIDQMVNYVKTKRLPIGMINFRGEPRIQFVTPYPGSFQSVLLLVFLPNGMGLLVQHNDISTVPIDALPDAIRRRWKDAGRVEFEKIAPPGPAASLQPLPLVAQEQPIEAPKRLKKPGVAPPMAAPSMAAQSMAAPSMAAPSMVVPMAEGLPEPSAEPKKLKKPGVAPSIKSVPLVAQEPPKKLKKPGIAPSSSMMVQDELQRLAKSASVAPASVAPASVAPASAKSAAPIASASAKSVVQSAVQSAVPSAVPSAAPMAVPALLPRPLSVIPESIEPVSAPRVVRAASKIGSLPLASASAAQSVAQSIAPAVPASAKSVAPALMSAPKLQKPGVASSVPVSAKSAAPVSVTSSVPRLKKPGVAPSAKSASAAPAPSAN